MIDRRTKTLLRIARQTLIILMVTAVLAEISFRVYNYFVPTFVFYERSYNRFRGKPNAPDYDFHLNSKGFKDVEFTPQKESGAYRIVGLGDSFAYGVVPYQYNYLTVLEENLNRGGKKTEVINMGIVATGPTDYLALLANEGLELKPDMVLVSFFIGNDFVREGGARNLYSYSYVLSFIHYLISVTKSYEGQIVHGPAVYNDDAPTMRDDDFIGIESQRSEIYRKQNIGFEGDFEAAVRTLMNIKQLCDENHIALAIVLIPDNVQVDRTLQARVLKLKEVNSKADDFDFELPNRSLIARLQEQNIVFIDLLGEFTRTGSRTLLYKPRDSHWNIAGNRLAADTIARELFHIPVTPSTPTSKPAGLPLH